MAQALSPLINYDLLRLFYALFYPCEVISKNNGLRVFFGYYRNCSKAWWEFRPRKKISSPPPPKDSPQTPSLEVSEMASAKMASAIVSVSTMWGRYWNSVSASPLERILLGFAGSCGFRSRYWISVSGPYRRWGGWLPRPSQIGPRRTKNSTRSYAVVDLLRVVFLVRRADLLSRRTLCGHRFPGNYRHFSSQRRVRAVVIWGA